MPSPHLNSNLPWHDLFLDLLKTEHEKQKEKNPRYSLRQWAKRLGISSGAVSEIFNGRRKVTPEKAIQIVEAAKIPPTQIKRLRAQMGQPVAVKSVAPKREDIELIQHWVNHAICGFYELNAVEVNTDFIASRLCRPREEIEMRTALLLKAGLLKRDDSGNIYRTKENWELGLTLSQDELQRVKVRLIEFSKWAAVKAPQKESHFLTLSFPGNATHIEYVRTELKRIVETLDARANAEPRNELIRFSAQIFPFRFTDSDGAPE